MQPRFITLEGIDGAGKSTHLKFIRQWFQSQHIPAVFTREPGGTSLGEGLRQLLLDTQSNISFDTETLLMFAGRMEHIQQIIRPALQRGEWVISDRFTDATFAYQGGGRGVSQNRIQQLEEWVQQGLQPDLTLLFTVPLDIAQQRMQRSRTLDRFEQEQVDFHERVYHTYLARATNNPDRFIILDTNRPPAEVQQDIEQTLSHISQAKNAHNAGATS